MNLLNRHVLISVAIVLLVTTCSHAAPLGIFDQSIHQNVEIFFQLPPTATVPPHTLTLGLASSLVPPTLGYMGCEFQLFDGGGLISSSTINSIFGCQGSWTSFDNSADGLNIASNVDLSGIAAGEVGRILMRPTFVGSVGIASLDSPGIFFAGAGTATILSQTINAIPEPDALLLLCVGGMVSVVKRRRRS